MRFCNDKNIVKSRRGKENEIGKTGTSFPNHKDQMSHGGGDGEVIFVSPSVKNKIVKCRE